MIEDDDLPNGWGPTLRDLEARRAGSRWWGGPERLPTHQGGGKLDGRQRVDALLDPGSFREIGTLVGGEVPSDAIVAGSGEIDGRPVMVGSEDFTTLAGTIASGSNSKRWRLAELALRTKVPLIMLLEGAGARPTGHEGRSPTDLLMQVRCSGHVPIVAGVMGPSAGHGALIVPVADYAVMTQQASVFTAGPPVVRQSTGEDVTKEELGGPGVAVPSGLIHGVGADDHETLAMIRRYLSFFPSSAWSYPPGVDGGDTAPRPTPELLEIIPRDNRRVYDMRRVLDVLFDDGDWFEIQPGFGPAMICALARLAGEPVAVVANQPSVLAGAIDPPAADKAAHFVTVADRFHLPIVFLADNPGMMPGTATEKQGVLRSGARMFAAVSLASTIKVHITLRKAYGFGSLVMDLLGFDGQVGTYAFPGATLGVMGAGASGKAMKADEDLAAELRASELNASYRSAEKLGFDELLDPRDTRATLIDALWRGLHARQELPEPVLRSAVTP